MEIVYEKYDNAEVDTMSCYNCENCNCAPIS